MRLSLSFNAKSNVFTFSCLFISLVTHFTHSEVKLEVVRKSRIGQAATVVYDELRTQTDNT